MSNNNGKGTIVEHTRAEIFAAMELLTDVGLLRVVRLDVPCQGISKALARIVCRRDVEQLLKQAVTILDQKDVVSGAAVYVDRERLRELKSMESVVIKKDS